MKLGYYDLLNTPSACGAEIHYIRFLIGCGKLNCVDNRGSIDLLHDETVSNFG